tara:strand:- start:4365 stop:4757 length:393 start_codon:yes stop_codon:yes gene_type:complete
MKIMITTVVDITQTGARRGDTILLVNQQANYNTTIQTIGLRVNINPILCTEKIGNVSKFGFGSAIKGEQRYWEFTFESEYEEALTLDMLTSDFDLVPIIINLNETSSITNSVFRTNHPNDGNIVFEIVEK